jgi:hypothetical protein
MAVLSIQGDWRECGIGQEFSRGGASVALVGGGWGGSAKTVGYHPVRVIIGEPEPAFTEWVGCVGDKLLEVPFWGEQAIGDTTAGEPRQHLLPWRLGCYALNQSQVLLLIERGSFAAKAMFGCLGFDFFVGDQGDAPTRC